jgi:pectinesterase
MARFLTARFLLMPPSMTSFRQMIWSAALIAPLAGCQPLGEGEDIGMTESAVTSTAARPQLTSTQAASDTVLKYLSQAGSVTAPTIDNWNPTAGAGDVNAFAPTFTVAASGGTYTTVQAAVNAASGTNRVYIKVMPGTYREVVCVKPTAPPITLYSTNSDASKTVIVFNNYAGKAKAETQAANPCEPNINPTPSVSNVTYQTYGTRGSATFAAYAPGFQAKNITFSNDFDETGVSGSVQAVALITQADKLLFDNVRMLGNQDTLLSKTTDPAVIARAYFKASYIEGDVDFICGRATIVFDASEVRFVNNRRSTGNILAPSTDSRNPYGILISGSKLTSSSGVAARSVTLGRAWDEGQVDLKTYAANIKTGIFPNGQSLIRDTAVGAQTVSAAPWAAAATTSRKFSSTSWSDSNGTYPANRLDEYNNTGS